MPRQESRQPIHNSFDIPWKQTSEERRMTLVNLSLSPFRRRQDIDTVNSQTNTSSKEPQKSG